MKRQLTSILLFSALLMGGASTFVSCKDYESDTLYETNGKIAEAVAQHAKDVKNLSDELSKEAAKRLSEDEILKGLITQASNDAAAAAQKAEEAAKQAGTNATEIGKIQTQLIEIESKLAAYAGLSDKLNDLAAKVENITSCNCNLTELIQKDAELEAKINEDKARIDAIEAGKANLTEQLEHINSTLNTKAEKGDLDALKGLVNQNANNIQQNKNAIDNINSKLANYVTTEVVNNKISDAETALKQAINEASQNLSGEIAVLDQRLTEQLNSMFNALAGMVTNIELEATESPINGYMNLSFLGLEAHILGSYYGTAQKEIEIGDQTINNQQFLLSDNGQNAGIVYVTINPSNYDFSGLTFKVVDSQGNEAPFTATVTKSDRILTYGVGRAGNNNLYAVKINLNTDRLAEAQTWTLEDAANLKDAASNILNKLKNRSNSLNIANIASTLETTFNNRLIAYGLQLKQDVTVNGKTETRYIKTKGSLAATAISPLSYDFLQNGIKYQLKDLPTLESKGLYINTDDLKWTNLNHIADINQNIEIDVPDASTMTIDGKKVTINASGELVWADPNNKTSIEDLKGVKVTVSDINFQAGAVRYNNKKQTVSVTVSMAQFNNMIDQINSQVGNMLGTVGNLANKVNGYVNTIDGQIINRVNTFIHKCNYWLNNANKFLQPTMFATDGTNWAKLPSISNGATYVKLGASIVLIPTSYTAELLAPAYKKYITVKDPLGNTVSGENIGKVLDGSVRKAGFTASKEGVYTITYEAVDYTGKKVTKDFFVNAVNK